MNRINTLVLLFYFFVPLCGASQKTEKKFAVTIDPALFSNHIVFQPGFQYTFNNWAVLGEVAYMSAKEMDFDEGHWLRTQLELKRFLTRDVIKFYGSFQTAFSARKFIDADSGFYFTNHLVDTGATYSSAVIHSPVLSFAPKIGMEASLGKIVFLDFFVGCGVRILFNRYDAQGVAPTMAFHKREWGPDAAWKFDQTVATFHLPMGLRLGFRF
jgi:hypothetical protein